MFMLRQPLYLDKRLKLNYFSCLNEDKMDWKIKTFLCGILITFLSFSVDLICWMCIAVSVSSNFVWHFFHTCKLKVHVHVWQIFSWFQFCNWSVKHSLSCCCYVLSSSVVSKENFYPVTKGYTMNRNVYASPKNLHLYQL